MTVAELARLFNEEFLAAPVELDTVLMSGWQRSDFYDASGLPWVPPSPNMPTPDTALVYSGTCLFEGTNLSEGRGTTRPFELLGAEGIDRRWAAAAERARAARGALQGGVLRADLLQVPGEDRRGRADPCARPGGLRPGAYRNRAAGDRQEGLERLRWRSDNWIDKLTGSTRVRTMIDAGADTDEVVAGWQEELAAFRRMRKKYLVYR